MFLPIIMMVDMLSLALVLLIVSSPWVGMQTGVIFIVSILYYRTLPWGYFRGGLQELHNKFTNITTYEIVVS